MSAEPTNTAATVNGASEPTSEVQARRTAALMSRPRTRPIGGQAVLEGVMMRGVSTWAVAVRVPHELATENASANGAGDGDHHLVEEAERRPRRLPRRRRAPDRRRGTAPSTPTASRSGGSRSTREPFDSVIKKRRLYRLPIIRGVVALVESLKIGMKALGISANAQLDEPEEELSGKTWGFTISLSLLFAVGLFFVLPVTIANFWKDDARQLGRLRRASRS